MSDLWAISTTYGTKTKNVIEYYFSLRLCEYRYDEFYLTRQKSTVDLFRMEATLWSKDDSCNRHPDG